MRGKTEIKVNQATISEALAFWLSQKVLTTDRVFTVESVKPGTVDYSTQIPADFTICLDFGPVSVEREG